MEKKIMNRYYKAIDVETTLIFSGLCDGKTCGEVKKVLNSIPAIDIVQCFECKHTDGKPLIADGRSWCEKHNSFMYYCSDGERKDNES